MLHPSAFASDQTLLIQTFLSYIDYLHIHASIQLHLCMRMCSTVVYTVVTSLDDIMQNQPANTFLRIIEQIHFLLATAKQQQLF